MAISDSDDVRINPIESNRIDVESLQLRVLKRPEPNQPVIKVSHIRLVDCLVAVLIQRLKTTVAAQLALVDVLRNDALHQE